MIQLLKNFFGLGPQVDYKELMGRGATIIDVRTTGEYQSGHVKGSVNIPLNNLFNNLSKFKKDKPIIICCASGTRSGSAKSMLKSHGFQEVYNGGGWMNLRNKVA